MKKLFFSAALALFALVAVAQTETTSKSDVKVTAKSKTKKDKEKVAEVNGTAKSESELKFRQDDLNDDTKLSGEEKAARKKVKKEKFKNQKADRTDDGLLNGSASGKNIHGKAVSELATGTTLEGREKGAAISGLAKTNSNGELRLEEKSGADKMTPEEKIARKKVKKEKNKSLKSDRADDGLLNGSSDNSIRGKAVSGTAVETKLRDKTKGAKVKTDVRTKTRVGTGLDISAGKKLRKG
ncbi:hypothetical protein [Daejeonella sp.]|uniref:hypothetical protein n=1 Tax=Daejeonella sp. TaxID=2805397 RepID=UPI003982DC0E